MLKTYKAVLWGDRVEWIDTAPSASDGVPVHLTVLEETSEPSPSRGKEMARALEALARAGGVTSIPDPASWERDIRGRMESLAGEDPLSR